MSNGSEGIPERDDAAEQAWADWQTANSRKFNLDRLSFMAGRDSLRSRIAALEAVIRQMGDATDTRHGSKLDRLDTIAALSVAATSTVLDQMIREAKAEAVEAARDAIMPPVNWNLRPDGTEMPGTEHIDGALHDIHVQLTALATEIRNGDA